MGVEEDLGHFVMSDGFNLSYRHWKTAGESRRVVLGLHGIGGHSGNFEYMGRLLPAQVQGTEVYAIDRRGFGGSVENGFVRGSMSSFARYLQDIDDTAELILKIRPGKLFVFGKSLGCFHALRFAANHPDSVEGLILAAPPIITPARLSPSLLVRVLLLLIFAPRTLVDSYRYQAEKLRESEEVKASQEDSLGAQGKFSARYLYGVSRFLRTGLKNAGLVRAPTLILQGDADNTVAPEGAKELLKNLASVDKTLRTFPDANHNFFDSLPPRPNSRYTEAQRQKIIAAIAEWMNLR